MPFAAVEFGELETGLADPVLEARGLEGDAGFGDLRRGAPGAFQRVEEIEAVGSLVGGDRTAPEKKARHHASTAASKDPAYFVEVVPYDRHPIVLEYGLDERRVERVVVVGES
jgi:hypothetical protein